MPSIAKSTHWFIRVTGTHDALKTHITTMMGWIDTEKLVAAFHVGDKTEKEHIHIALVLSHELQKQSIDVRIKQLFGVKGQGQYSNKLWDKADECIAYMFHEKEAWIISKGYEQDELDKFKALNESVQKVVAVNRERASCKLVDKLIQEFTQKEDVTEWALFQCAMNWIREGMYYHPGMFILKKYIEQVFIQVSTPAQFDLYTSTQFQNLFRR